MSVKLPDIIGLPFDMSGMDEKTQIQYKNSLPVMSILPMESTMHAGVHFMMLVNAAREYKRLLEAHGFTLPFDNIKLAFTLEGSINDGASNSYGETFLSRLANVASEPLFEARQILGITSMDNLIERLKKAENVPFHNAAAGALDKANKVGKVILGEKGTDLAVNLAMGSRIDMPQIWKGSSSNMDYSVTVKLYNPDPSSETQYKKYILGPIVALLLLALPRADTNGDTYKWPFYCRAFAPGLFQIKMGALKDISISKGGNSTAFTYDQKPSLVEIRLTIGELFSNRVVTSNGTDTDLFPTLKGYINSMLVSKSTLVHVQKLPHYDKGSPTQQIAKINRTEIKDRFKNRVGVNKLKESVLQASNQGRTQMPILTPQELVKQHIAKVAKKSNIVEKVLGVVKPIVSQSEQPRLTISALTKEVERNIKTIANMLDYVQSDPSSAIQRLGQNSFVNISQLFGVIDSRDFLSEKDSLDKAIGYIKQGFNIEYVTQQQPQNIAQIIKTSYDILTSGASALQEKIPNNIKIGENTYIDFHTKTAIISQNDFSTPAKAYKKSKDLEKSGFDVKYVV